MLWLLAGAAILTVLLLGMRAFERASAATIISFLKWLAALSGIALAVLLLLSGQGPRALSSLVLVGPLVWRRWRQFGSHFTGTGAAGGAGSGGEADQRPPRQSSAMSQAEAYEVLGLRPGADAAAIHAAHRRLMRMAHPDTGGSDWLASRINQARDVLLG